MAEQSEILARLKSAPMSAAQVLAVALCTAINVIDGFDILAIAFTAPAIVREWSLSSRQLGLLFSAGLIGMTLGALAVSPLSDFWGRRRSVMLALVIISAGMFASAAAQSLELLLSARFLTGAGVGAMMPTINTVVAEVANSKRRDLAVCLQGAGFPLGGTLGGLAMLAATGTSWRVVFLAGGALSLAMLLPAALWMPESIQFLVARRPARALERVNALLRRFGMSTIEQIAGEGERVCGPRPTVREVLAGSRSATICGCFFLLMFTFYFLTSWIPKLLTDQGLPLNLGISGAILMNIGGVMGDLAFSILMLRYRASRLGPVFMAGCMLCAVAIALLPTRLDLLAPAAFFLGFLLFGSMLSLYAVLPTVFPADLRVTGSGLALGVGRIGATAGPYLGGVILGLGTSPAATMIVLSAPLIACAALLSRRPSDDVEADLAN